MALALLSKFITDRDIDNPPGPWSVGRGRGDLLVASRRARLIAFFSARLKVFYRENLTFTSLTAKDRHTNKWPSALLLKVSL